MRFLKNKIALSAQLRAHEAIIGAKPEIKEVPNLPKTKPKTKETPVRASKNTEKSDKNKEDTKSTKTVVKNYGKAIASFAISQIAVPYITPYLDQENVKLADFVGYIGKAKETIEGIDTFRTLLLVKEGDDDKVAAFKRIFRETAEVFIKYFSVNWIFSGRMMNKKVHLKFRFKMLRRIMNPELFTYLK